MVEEKKQSTITPKANTQKGYSHLLKATDENGNDIILTLLFL